MTHQTTLTDGSEVTPDHREIDPKTGMQKGYVVLSEAERAKGFVRPYRDTYTHRGVAPRYPTRPLSAEEGERYAAFKYVLFEQYPPEMEPLTGKFWTERELNSGCGSDTTMGRSIAETYARQPDFYGGTFCVHCRAHFPLDQFVWAGTSERVGS